MNAQYTLGKSYGNTGGSNEALTAGQQRADAGGLRLRQRLQQLRRAAHVQPQRALSDAVRPRPQHAATGVADALLGGWDIGGIVNARSGLPINVLVTRPDVVYRGRAPATSSRTRRPAASAVINTPGGGASRNVRRPDLIPGVDPFINDGGLLFLNPAAFATPSPGTFGNLRAQLASTGRTSSRSTWSSRSTSRSRRARNVEFRIESLQPVQHGELPNPVGTLPLRSRRRR